MVHDPTEYWKFREARPLDAAIRDGATGEIIQGGASNPRAISCEGYRQQISEFCRAIHGENSSVISGTEAARSLAIIEAIYGHFLDEIASISRPDGLTTDRILYAARQSLKAQAIAHQSIA